MDALYIYNMTTDCALITYGVRESNYYVYMIPYDKELFEKLDSHDANYEFDYWDGEKNWLDIGSELHDVKIVMIRTIIKDYGGIDRHVES